MTSDQWSELNIIRRFIACCRVDNEQVIKGIGDDCAIIQPDSTKQWVITTDMLVDTIHFDTSWHPAYQLGRKCLAVNLSDIAAMGACPQFILVSVGIPDFITPSWLDQWIQGMSSMMNEFNCSLIGGDTVRSSQLTINITAIGTATKSQVILRSSASPGESIFVSGCLGSAAAGLVLSRDAKKLPPIDADLAAPFIERHLNPHPDVQCGKLLAASGLVTAMQDLSDGLATDLAHIAEQSGIGAVVETVLLPAHAHFERITTLIGLNPVQLQVSGGDDYHLVFTVREGAENQLKAFLHQHGGPPIYRIGKTVKGSGVTLITSDGSAADISFCGFEHRGTT